MIVALGIAAASAMVGVFVVLWGVHMHCRLHARLAKQWMTREKEWSRELLGLKDDALEYGAPESPAVNAVFEALAKQFVADITRARIRAWYYQTRIPKRVRAWYLRTTE